MNYFLRSIFIFFASLYLFESCLSSYEKYDEYIVEDDDESLYCFSRYAFPSTCRRYYQSIIGVEHTWMEPEPLEVINTFSDYLNKIPKIYDSDCSQCYDCNGVKFNMYRGCSYPTDEVDAFDELHKGHVQSKRGYGKYCTRDNDHCESSSWYGGYFRLWNHKYIHFFNDYLKYSSENLGCDCYWPELDLNAMNINNQVYNLMKDLAEKDLITYEFSPYWEAKSIAFTM